QLYRDAALPVDAQGALSEAFSQAQSIEAGVAAINSSAEALETPGWGNVKSVAEVWADVHAEQAALHLRLGNTDKAGEEYEKAIGWYPNHNAATVGLSNLLLDYYTQRSSTGETWAELPVEETPSSQPILATLPTIKSLSRGSAQDTTLKDGASPNLLSRLAARDRACGLLSMLTKCGTGWDDSEAWSALARVYEESGQIEKAKEALWWVVELEDISSSLPRPINIIDPFSGLSCYMIMSERKRKRMSQDAGSRPSKKFATEGVRADVVKISFPPKDDEWAPIVASTPGVTFPPKLSMKAYKKPRSIDTSSVGKSAIETSEHLLHSSTHPRVDYVARDEEAGRSEGLLKHYIGVFDEQAGKLELVRARPMVLRGHVRVTDEDAEPAAKAPKGLSARATLGLEFGSKKSQRAIQALTKNAISPMKPGRPAPGSSQSVKDPVASAVVSSMAATTSSMPTRQDLQAAADESKPRPQPDLSAETPADVYPIDQLVGQGTLRQMTVEGWQSAVEEGEDILTKSRFVSHRIQAVVSSGDIRKIKVLKYLLLLLDWYGALLDGPKGRGRKVPHGDKLQEKLGTWGSELVQQVTHRFAGDRSTVNRWQLDNIITHLCALAITIDDFTTDVHDLREDLKLENKAFRTYFREIGAKVGPPLETERARMKIGKAEASSHQLAKLRLPLEFPKMRVLVTRGRKKK
ncbi:MAG: hypothetical protein Q9174_005442, partial [Haloplaca sp. 1 TL-2023]